MTAAQRATLEQMRLLLGACDTWRLAETETGRDECGNCAGRLREHEQADALRASLGTCATCAYAAERLSTADRYTFCAPPNDHDRFPFLHKQMPLGERCTGWTAKEGA